MATRRRPRFIQVTQVNSRITLCATDNKTINIVGPGAIIIITTTTSTIIIIIKTPTIACTVNLQQFVLWQCDFTVKSKMGLDRKWKCVTVGQHRDNVAHCQRLLPSDQAWPVAYNVYTLQTRLLLIGRHTHMAHRSIYNNKQTNFNVSGNAINDAPSFLSFIDRLHECVVLLHLSQRVFTEVFCDKQEHVRAAFKRFAQQFKLRLDVREVRCQSTHFWVTTILTISK